MNIGRQLIGESAQPASNLHEQLPVVIRQRAENYQECPHCKQEIYEKHVFYENDIAHHSDCGGAIKFPPPSPEEQAWLDKLLGRK